MTGKYFALMMVLLVLVAIQFIPVEQTNPRVVGEIEVPSDVADVLRTSCYDCHSNETIWPVYAKVAPFSWLMSRDVRIGREELNFSEWSEASDRRKDIKLEQIEDEVTEGKMPLWFYLPLHPDARLSDEEKALIVEWSRAERERIGYEPESE